LQTGVIFGQASLTYCARPMRFDVRSAFVGASKNFYSIHRANLL
jgi:hypothetical protein